jgi:hypothetical protein
MGLYSICGVVQPDLQRVARSWQYRHNVALYGLAL